MRDLPAQAVWSHTVGGVRVRAGWPSSLVFHAHGASWHSAAPSIARRSYPSSLASRANSQSIRAGATKGLEDEESAGAGRRFRRKPRHLSTMAGAW